MPPTKTTTNRRSSRIRQRSTRQTHTLDVSNSPNSNRTVNTEELEHVENNSTNIVLNSVRELSTTVKQLQAQINSVTNTVNKITQETSTGGNVLRRSGVSQTISSESTRTSPPTFTDSIANISGSEDLLNTCNNNANIQNVVVDPCNLSVSPYMNTFNESNVQTKQTFQPALPLACTVSDEMKAKIWANQYINFGQLLPEEENFATNLQP